VLSTQEKHAGTVAFKALIEKGVPESALASAKDGANPSPYAQYIISAKKFFSGQLGTINRTKLLRSFALGCLIFICATGTTYAANTSLPGDLLYPIKVSVNEPIERALAFGPTAKAQVAVRQAVERVKEASELSMSGKIDPATQDLISAEIIVKSEAARQSIFLLQEQQAREDNHFNEDSHNNSSNGSSASSGPGNASVHGAAGERVGGQINTSRSNTAQNISAVFENSIAAYKRNIEAHSPAASTSTLSQSASEQGQSVQKILNTLNLEIQKIKNQDNGSGQENDSGNGALINDAANVRRGDNKKNWSRTSADSYKSYQLQGRGQASTSVTNTTSVSNASDSNSSAAANASAGSGLSATSALDLNGTASKTNSIQTAGTQSAAAATAKSFMNGIIQAAQNKTENAAQ
jgi:hypothetical protein